MRRHVLRPLLSVIGNRDYDKIRKQGKKLKDNHETCKLFILETESIRTLYESGLAQYFAETHS
jgi:hypothetical protein